MKFSELENFDEFVLIEDELTFYIKVPLGANVSPFNAWDSEYNEYILLDDDAEVTKTGELMIY